MGDSSAIEWTDATWNPIRGCSRVSEGCRNCYAERVAARFSRPGDAYEGLARMTPAGPRWTGELRLIEEHLEDPLRWKRPRRIFVNSMSDLFHEKVEDDWLHRIYHVMERARQHTFQVLTKRPERMQRYLAWRWGEGRVPSFHIQHGVSVEKAQHLERLDVLRSTLSRRRFVSFEPLLGDLGNVCLNGIDWTIFGGESGPGARPCAIPWIRRGVFLAQAAGCAVFVKQLGSVPVVGYYSERWRNFYDEQGWDWPEPIDWSIDHDGQPPPGQHRPHPTEGPQRRRHDGVDRPAAIPPPPRHGR